MNLMAMGRQYTPGDVCDRMICRRSGWRIHLNKLAAWISLMLVSIALAQATGSLIVAASDFQAEDATPRLSQSCEGAGQGLLYVGLNSWIPAQACTTVGDE
ncbi:MAG TPA: hypothetical protein VGL99_20665 [Chloroflexota bacterium]|jgi:hypothetical protein